MHGERLPPGAALEDPDGFSAWNPGIGTGIPREFRALETIFRPECVFGTFAEVDELVRLTGLPAEELTEFRPQRLALHELIARITADIAIAEGEAEEDFGHNFRRVARTIGERYIEPQMPAIAAAHAAVRRDADVLVRAILAETLAPPAAPPPPRRQLFAWLRRSSPPPPPEPSASERQHHAVQGYKAAGLATDDPLRRAIFKSLYRVLGAISARRGQLGADLDLLARLVVRHVGNSYGSQVVGQQIEPLVAAAIQAEGYARIPNQAEPILISLKGASAAGKSSLRPMLKRMLREQGIDGYVTISPDIWRRLLLDYESLGPARKYAGHLTGRELMVVDGKNDRYIRAKANRDQAIPHFVVDRFRFDSFSSEQVARILHDTYARYVHTMYMYFVVTPPEQTVERGWRRALERGRYKAVEDFLGHSVEAYQGMPKILFKWIANKRLDYRYFFLDNRVPKGSFPTTIAFGNREQMSIVDPLALVDIERYQKVNIHAASPDEVYPSVAAMRVGANLGFLRECLRRIPRVDLVERGSDVVYARASHGRFERLDAAALQRVLASAELAEVLAAIAPELS